jgi:hypothetical protein
MGRRRRSLWRRRHHQMDLAIGDRQLALKIEPPSDDDPKQLVDVRTHLRRFDRAATTLGRQITIKRLPGISAMPPTIVPKPLPESDARRATAVRGHQRLWSSTGRSRRTSLRAVLLAAKSRPPAPAPRSMRRDIGYAEKCRSLSVRHSSIVDLRRPLEVPVGREKPAAVISAQSQAEGLRNSRQG